MPETKTKGRMLPGDTRPSLIVFSHLRWGIAWRRPQHLLSRLARDFRVHFVEEPVHSDGEPCLITTVTECDVEVVVPHTRCASPGFHDDQLPVLSALLSQFMAERGIVAPLVWLYTPMALPLVGDLRPRGLIYDCLGDLASLAGAPRQMLQREGALLRLADLVLTCGPSLCEARRERHPNVHCVPSAVDAARFDMSTHGAGDGVVQFATWQHESMRRPRLGFFGVIDERIDFALLDRLAVLRPAWSFAMVGPVAQLDPQSLPQHPNIHWLGARSHDALPGMQVHWDVCILPYALNAATQFMSPATTLEYLAGGMPVVSTPVRDVARLYGSVVRIAHGPAAFAAACDSALGESGPERTQRKEATRRLVRCCSWDATMSRVRSLIQDLGWVAPPVDVSFDIEEAPSVAPAEASGQARPAAV